MSFFLQFLVSFWLADERGHSSLPLAVRTTRRGSQQERPATYMIAITCVPPSHLLIPLPYRDECHDVRFLSYTSLGLRARHRRGPPHVPPHRLAVVGVARPFRVRSPAAAVYSVVLTGRADVPDTPRRPRLRSPLTAACRTAPPSVQPCPPALWRRRSAPPSLRPVPDLAPAAVLGRAVSFLRAVAAWRSTASPLDAEVRRAFSSLLSLADSAGSVAPIRVSPPRADRISLSGC